ncbi:hypothetical protein HZH66_013767 [Vespula vulgaris]|uniref:Odorant receptor n=1 Tax=Vespula vulgaris TaxID=7454 RepID=A0A834J3Q9_VESVU|nr:hypothetical protein HZH66_013767 [Vespula vulgaris]
MYHVYPNECSKNHSKELQKILKFKLHELSNDTQAHDIVTAVPQRLLSTVFLRCTSYTSSTLDRKKFSREAEKIAAHLLQRHFDREIQRIALAGESNRSLSEARRRGLEKGKIVTPQNITIRPLPCSGYYIFFDDQISPNYEIIFCLQCISGLVTYSITTAICGLAALFVMHTCGQLEILVELIEGIVEKTDNGENQTNKLISITVEHQIRVRSFLQTVEVTMHQICLFELMGCTLTMCFFGYCLITDWSNRNPTSICTYFIGLSSVTSHIFMFCFVGEQLTLQAEKVALTSCVLDWYRLPNNKAKSVILIMAISHCPMRITAGNVIELSLQTFGQVIKTAAAYCNILRTIHANNFLHYNLIRHDKN